GTLLIAVNDSTPGQSMLEVGYQAHVLHGGLAYEWTQVSFQVRGVGSLGSCYNDRRQGRGDKDSGWVTDLRELGLRNHFPVPMSLLSLSMVDCQVG
ncbi:unnamed protein product, partial [Choristocarpus tenellus]